jgi:hypothetical protein
MTGGAAPLPPALSRRHSAMDVSPSMAVSAGVPLSPSPFHPHSGASTVAHSAAPPPPPPSLNPPPSPLVPIPPRRYSTMLQQNGTSGPPIHSPPLLLPPPAAVAPSIIAEPRPTCR